MNPILQSLSESVGIHFMGQQNLDFQKENASLRMTYNGFACDAQPSLITTSNAGIPAFLSTYIDPALIKVLVSPMMAAEIAGREVKKGDWTTKTAMFLMTESTGEVASYGDFSEDGMSNANVNFPQRQSYHYQTNTNWGELELETAGLAKVDWANQQNIASVLVLNKFQNKSYFFGVEGLENYGLLNDPNLSAPISPTTKTIGGTSWVDATALEVLADIQKLWSALQTQANGLLNLDSKMTLAMSSTSQVALTKTTNFNVNVSDILAKNFPNMIVKVAPEYSTDSGELVQLYLDEVDGQRTVDVAFTEKLRAHPIIVAASSFRQKKSQGTFGAIIYRPVFVKQMLGV